ncbi:DUF305 domain-containing protein [Oceanicella sp. SM1341]|uniref:DUF305 domain-containing protein n=1 Tax=Oceanicella sp. SM1341 TaxID=1548889 RepID=UPI0018E51486|nr:DUF305 domain-containing protein [Oceanicella sp. SM1341]
MFRSFPCRALPALPLLLATATGAAAHVKWFAPYIIDAQPQPPGQVLSDPWFWCGIALVLVFFLATRLVEAGPWHDRATGLLDRLTAPIRARLDDYVRVTVGAFFVAIFAVGGVYLTPDLKTPVAWVSWLQLLIAACIFFRPTMPIAAAGIIALWLLAMRDYDLFHLFDYLALGLGVAAYLLLFSLRSERLRACRFEALRWGLAVALMWSSLEKFAYPDWFSPLVEERPFLTFGLPERAFIPMAGVAEFAMGFGLIWTPLIRRLSAVALLVIFTAAVFPFGRVDLIGHGLIMAILVATAADSSQNLRLFSGLRHRLPAIPPALCGALVLFAGLYWGLHAAFYGAGGRPAVPVEITTHSPDPDHPHTPQGHDH